MLDFLFTKVDMRQTLLRLLPNVGTPRVRYGSVWVRATVAIQECLFIIGSLKHNWYAGI